MIAASFDRLRGPCVGLRPLAFATGGYSQRRSGRGIVTGVDAIRAVGRRRDRGEVERDEPTSRCASRSRTSHGGLQGQEPDDVAHRAADDYPVARARHRTGEHADNTDHCCTDHDDHRR